jgi:hypothetical protein
MFSPPSGPHGGSNNPDYGFLLLTWSTGPMEWSTGNSYGIDKRFEVSYMLIKAP